MDLGYNCIIYDLRGHGENAPTFTTYGTRESKDLKCLIDDTKERYADLSELVLHGESLGAATTITVLGEKPEVDYVVADCGFSDMTDGACAHNKERFHTGASRCDIMITLNSLAKEVRYERKLYS